MRITMGGVFIALLAACNSPALDREISAETALNDVIDIEAQEEELPRYHQKFLNSIAFIADDEGIDQTKISELFKLFTDSAVTYRMVFAELEAKYQFQHGYTQQHLLPIYKQIDSLCHERQAVVSILLYGTPKQIDSLLQTGADTNFLSYINPNVSKHYQYTTPEILDGQCAYISKQDALHKQYDSIYNEMQKERLSKFYLTTTYYNKLNKMFDVHQ